MATAQALSPELELTLLLGDGASPPPLADIRGRTHLLVGLDPRVLFAVGDGGLCPGGTEASDFGTRDFA